MADDTMTGGVSPDVQKELGSADPDKPWLVGTTGLGSIERIYVPDGKGGGSIQMFDYGRAAKLGVPHVSKGQVNADDGAVDETPTSGGTVSYHSPDDSKIVVMPASEANKPPYFAPTPPLSDYLPAPVNAVLGGVKQSLGGTPTSAQDMAMSQNPTLTAAAQTPFGAAQTIAPTASALANALPYVNLPAALPGMAAKAIAEKISGIDPNAPTSASKPAPTNAPAPIPANSVNLRGASDASAPAGQPSPLTAGSESGRVAVKPGVNAKVPNSPDDIEQQLRDANLMEKGANSREASLKGDQANAEAALQDESASKQQESIQRQEESRQKYEAQREQDRKQLHDAAMDLVNSKIDPNHLWHSQSTGASIGLILGNVLSGFGAGLAGHQATNLIEQAVNKDIEAQKANNENKRAGVNLMRDLMNDNRLDMKDKTEAEAALRNAYIEKVKTQADSLAKRFGGPMAMAAADRLNAQLDQVKAKNILEARKGKAEITGINLRNQGQALENEQRRQGMALAEYYRQTGQMPPGTPSINVEGQVVPLSDKEQFKGLNQVGTSYAVADKDLGQLEDAFNKHLTSIKLGGAGYGPMVKELAENVANHIGHAQGLENVPSADAIKQYATMLADPKIQASPEDMKRIINGLRTSLDTGTDTFFNQHVDYFGRPINSPGQVRRLRAQKALQAAGAQPVR